MGLPPDGLTKMTHSDINLYILVRQSLVTLQQHRSLSQKVPTIHRVNAIQAKCQRMLCRTWTLNILGFQGGTVNPFGVDSKPLLQFSNALPSINSTARVAIRYGFRPSHVPTSPFSPPPFHRIYPTATASLVSRS